MIFKKNKGNSMTFKRTNLNMINSAVFQAFQGLEKAISSIFKHFKGLYERCIWLQSRYTI